jgi:hypothetical protein
VGWIFSFLFFNRLLHHDRLYHTIRLFNPTLDNIGNRLVYVFGRLFGGSLPRHWIYRYPEKSEEFKLGYYPGV